MGELITYAWRELTRRKGRALVNVTGYAIATATMIVLVSVLLQSRKAQESILSSTGTHFVAFVPAGGQACAECVVLRPAEENEGFVAWGVLSRLMPIRLINDMAKLPSVKAASPYLMYRFYDSRTKRAFTAGGFVSEDMTAVGTTCCAPSDVKAGRFLTVADHNMVMLDEGFATQREFNIGEKLSVGGRLFEIVGIVNSGIRPAKADVYFHFKDLEELINSRLDKPMLVDKANLVLVEVMDSRHQKEAMNAVRTVLPELVVYSYACYGPAAAAWGVSDRAAWLLTGLVCLTAMLFALKSQMASIVERRREIGILKTIGWPNSDVVKLVLAESLLLAALGALIGIALSLGALFLPTTGKLLSGAQPPIGAVSPLVICGAVLLVLITGAIAGIIPAWYAGKLRPSEAIRRV